jgi:hypothetical protein
MTSPGSFRYAFGVFLTGLRLGHPVAGEKFGHRKETGRAVAAAAGGRAYSPASFGIGVDPGHHEHRSPSTRVPTEDSGLRSSVRISDLAARGGGLAGRLLFRGGRMPARAVLGFKAFERP